ASASYGDGSAALLSENGWLAVRDAIRANPTLLDGKATFWVPAETAIDLAAKGHGTPEAEAAYARLKQAGAVRKSFNAGFLTRSNSNDPTRAGIWGAFKGSLLTMLVTLALAFPIGVLSAVYLEEYAPRNRMT